MCGAVIVNFGSFTPVDLAKTLDAGVASAAHYETADVLRIYGLELLASIGGPIARPRGPRPRRAPARGVLQRGRGPPVRGHPADPPPGRDPGARDAAEARPVPAPPAAVLSVARHPRGRRARGCSRPPRARGAASPPPVLALVFGWQAALVVDGERELPHRAAERRDALDRRPANVAKGASVTWPTFENELAARGFDATKTVDKDQPDFIVAELYLWNHFLSGTGLRESYPKDWRTVFDALSQERLEAFQNVYRGTAGYARGRALRRGLLHARAAASPTASSATARGTT